MMSSKPTAYLRICETKPNPYPPSYSMAPGSQQPLSFISLGNQAQSGQPAFITSPGTFTNSRQGPGNIQMAVQIMIGLMHTDFKIILGLMASIYNQVLGFASLSFTGGYPFWGDLSFTITGALSISASKQFSPCLIKGSLGMNTVNSVFAFFGVILLLVDVSINGLPNQDYWAVPAGKGISAMLIIFSLEFCITCVTAHFASQAITNTSGSVLAIPIVYANSPLTTGWSSGPPRNDGHQAHTT
ncbi:LOW QUALITY PROTEIN: membrane-spanning 4-domains subfamily A member 12-like [Megaptera novaeangliae]